MLSGKISTDFDVQTSLGDSQAAMSFSIENVCSMCVRVCVCAHVCMCVCFATTCSVDVVTVMNKEQRRHLF